VSNEIDYTVPNGAGYLLQGIADEGITHAFLVPGYMVEPFLSKFEEAGITPIVACQEGGAAYMADGYARASRKFGLAMGIGGPGVSNMITAVAAAYSDRSPVLVVAGNTPNNLEGVGSFQDSGPSGVDDRDLFLPITTFTEVIPDKSLIGSFLRKAIKAMKGYENQPAFLSMGHDMQLEPMSYNYDPITAVEAPRILDTEAAQQVPELLARAERITILAGNGVIWSDASEELQAFANRHSIPVVTTTRAKGAIPEDDEMSMGIFGVGGSLWANQVVMGDADADGKTLKPGADVLLVLGATLNETNTHGWLPDFVPKDSIIRVDINPNNIVGKEYDERFVTGDVKTFLQWLNANHEGYGGQLKSTLGARQAWLAETKETPFYDTEAARTSDAIPILPPRVITDLRKVAPRNTIMIVDSGAHSYFAAHNWTSYRPNEFFLLTTTGPMGYGVAMTVGAMMARPDQPHCAVVGDGSLWMHGIEIHTAVRYKLPMVIVVINNSSLANVYLRTKKESDEAMKLSMLPTQDWAAFAKSLGADGVVVEDPADLVGAFDRAFATTDRPFIVDTRCDMNMPTPNIRESS
jgi:acetolactate synthase-1/2/3 large subunit